MTKRNSEADVRAALTAIADDVGLFAYKPPDDARTSKPADFFAWWPGGQTVESAWLEVKDTKAVGTFNWNAMMTPAQIAAIRTARELQLPYYLVVYWRTRGEWTISNARTMGADFDVFGDHGRTRPFTKVEMMSRYGVQCWPGQLSSTLKSVLLEATI